MWKEFLTARSPYYNTQRRYPLPVPTAEAPTPVYNRATQEYETPEDPTPPEPYEIHAQQQQSRATPELPGVDLSKAPYACRVVRSPPGKPLKLPETMIAGSGFALTVFGKKGTAVILPVPDPQHPTEARILGQVFFAEWNSLG